MLQATPQSEADASVELLRESRMEAFRWASEAVRHEFTAATWSMFWQSTVDDQAVDGVAKKHNRTSVAVYLTRYHWLISFSSGPSLF